MTVNVLATIKEIFNQYHDNKNKIKALTKQLNELNDTELIRLSGAFQEDKIQSDGVDYETKLQALVDKKQLIENMIYILKLENRMIDAILTQLKDHNGFELFYEKYVNQRTYEYIQAHFYESNGNAHKKIKNAAQMFLDIYVLS